MGNWLSSLFSNKEKTPKIKYDEFVTSIDEAILQLKIARDKIHKERKKNDQITSILTEKAKLVLSENKPEKAKLLLRRRKYLVKRISQLEGQLHSLETMIDTIEEKAIEKAVFDGLRQGTDELQRIQQELSLENIEKHFSS